MAERTESATSVGPTMSNRSRPALAHTMLFVGALPPVETAVLATLLASLCIATVAGNALVMLSFYLDRSLRTHTNYFVLSLATSDMLLGVFAMPIYSYYLLRGEWTLGRVLCDLFLTLDYMPCTASILNLLVIGLDRYLSVTRPLRYRARRTGRQVALMIGSAWVTSFLLWPPWIWSWQYIDGRRTVPDDDCYVQFLETNFYLTMVTSILHYYLPLTLILLLYYGIWRETRNRERYLAGMEAKRQCGIVPEDSRSNPKASHKSTRGFLLGCCLKIDRGSTKVTSEECRYDVRQTLWSAGVVSDSELVHPRRNTDDKPEFTESHSIKDEIGKEEHNSASSKTKGFPLEDVSSSHRPNVPSPAFVHLCRKADDKKDFTCGESSAKDKTANDLDETACNKNEGLPLVDVSSYCETTKNVSSNNSGALRGENKAARVLTAILLAFIVTTTPYNVTVIVKYLDPTDSLVPEPVWYFIYFLFYVNSTLNPLCYALANRNFKRTYWKILTCSWNRQGERISATGEPALLQDSRSLQQSRTCTTPL